MAKIPMRCPFNDRLCIECNLYRGRHYYMCYCEQYRGYIKPKNIASTNENLKTADFESIKRSLEPWSATRNGNGEISPEKKIKLKVIDMESGKERNFELAEAKTWEWDNPSIMRIVAGSQVNSWTKLCEMVQYYQEKDAAELVIYEAPSFMMIAGG